MSNRWAIKLSTAALEIFTQCDILRIFFTVLLRRALLLAFATTGPRQQRFQDLGLSNFKQI
jgi:hypothetical protein